MTEQKNHKTNFSLQRGSRSRFDWEIQISNYITSEYVLIYCDRNYKMHKVVYNIFAGARPCRMLISVIY